MTTSAGQVQLDLVANKKPFENALSSLDGVASRIGKRLGGLLSVAAVAKFGKQCLELASDLNEVQNVVDVTFSRMSGKVDEWAAGAAERFGLSETMAKRYAGTFGSMAEAFGFTEKEAYGMSTALTGLAGDVASFYNISQDMAYTKLKSVFSGETETLKDLGIVMTQSALDAYAMSNGFGKVTKDMTEAEKVSLRFAFVQSQLSNASGDFARTSGSWANQVRLLSLRFDSLRATVGQSLIAALLPVVKVLNGIVLAATNAARAFNRMVESVTGKSMAELTGGAQDAGAAVVDLGDVSGESAQSASDLASAQDAATKAAEKQDKAQRKLNRALAGFDKINKLTAEKAQGTSNPSSGVPAASAAAAASPVSASIPSLESGAAKAREALASMKLPKSLVAAISRLKTAWDELFGVLKGAGKWVLDNVLKPLGKWTLNKLAPAVVDLLAAAMRVLSKVLKALAPVWKVVWNRLFKPLAKFAGDVVVAMIEGIAGALNMIADFAEKHPKAFRAITLGLLGLFGASKLKGPFVKLLTWSMSGTGLKGLFKIISSNPIVKKLSKPLKALFTLVKRHPVAAVVIGVATAIGYVYKNWNKIRKTKIGKAVEKLGKKLEPIGGRIGKSVEKLMGKLSEAAGKLWAALKPIVEKALDKIIEWAGNAVEVLGDTLVGAIEGLCTVVDALSEGWNAISDKAPKLVAEAKEKVDGALSTLKGAWDSIADKTAGFFAEVKTKWSDLKKSWDELAANASDKVADFKARVATTWDDIKNAWEGLKSSAAGKVADFKAQVATAWDDLKKAWENLRNSAQGKIADISMRIATAWEDLKKAWQDNLDKFKGKAVEIAMNLGQRWMDLKERWQDNLDKFQGKVVEMSMKLGSLYQDLKERWQNARNNFQGKVVEMSMKLGSLYQDLRVRWQNARKCFQGKVVSIAMKLGNMWNSLKQSWLNNLRCFQGKTVEIGMQISAAVGNVKNFANGVIDYLNGKLNTLTWPQGVPGIGGKSVLPWNPIPRFAQGGWVARNTPQLAVIGDNAREGEIVSPESKFQAMLDKASAQGGDASQLLPVLNAILEAIRAQDTATYLDGRQLASAVVREVNRQTNATGRCPIRV